MKICASTYSSNYYNYNNTHHNTRPGKREINTSEIFWEMDTIVLRLFSIIKNQQQILPINTHM